MSEQAKPEAFDAIHDEAVRLLEFDMPDEVRKGLERIISLAPSTTSARSRADPSSTRKPTSATASSTGSW